MHTQLDLVTQTAKRTAGATLPELWPNQSLARAGTVSGFRRAVVAAEALADLLTITFTITAVCRLGYHWHWMGKSQFYGVAGPALAWAGIMVLMLKRAGAYGHANSLLRVRETEQVLWVSTEVSVAALVATSFGHFLFPRSLLLLCFLLVPLLLFAQKALMYVLVQNLHSRGHGIQRVLIYGAGATGRRVFSLLKRSPKLGLDPIAFIDDDFSKSGNTVFEMAYDRRRYAPVVHGAVSRKLLEQYRIDLVIIAIPSIGRDNFTRTVQEALASNVRVSFVPSLFLSSDSLLDHQDLDGVLLASFGQSTGSRGYEVLKRSLDFAGSLALLVVGAPLLIMIGCAIKVDSSGPLLFTQKRVGKNGKHFTIYKFRTMHVNALPYELSPSSPSDPRITRVGRFLRRTSLDEIPQLLNVLKGEMSLVGPRPEMPFIVERYSARDCQRLQVKPGLTGLWQLSGDRAFLIHENLEYDLYYMQNRNLFMDLAILLHTAIFAMRGI